MGVGGHLVDFLAGKRHPKHKDRALAAQRLQRAVIVAAALAQLLDHRYSAELPTILTAASSPEVLERREGHPLARLDDSSLLERLRGAERVEMVPALKPWFDRVER